MRHIYMAILSCCLHTWVFSQHPAYTINNYGDTLLLGIQTFKQLQQPPFNDWFLPATVNARFSTKITTSLHKKIEGIHFEIFMGTWCSDSRREVPKLYALLNHLHIPDSAITVVCVDNEDSTYKQSPGHEEAGKYIFRVPTLRLLKEGNEVGRIIEYPKKSWETDILTILSGKKYMPNYFGGLSWMQFIDSVDAELIIKDSTTLAKYWIKHIESKAELNSAGYIYESTGIINKAFASYLINRLIFPADSRVLNNLGRVYNLRGQKSEAKACFEEALKIEPTLISAAQALKQLQ